MVSPFLLIAAWLTQILSGQSAFAILAFPSFMIRIFSQSSSPIVTVWFLSKEYVPYSLLLTLTFTSAPLFPVFRLFKKSLKLHKSKGTNTNNQKKQNQQNIIFIRLLSWIQSISVQSYILPSWVYDSAYCGT